MGFFFFQAEDGIRDAQESRGLGDVYKRQAIQSAMEPDLGRRHVQCHPSADSVLHLQQILH